MKKVGNKWLKFLCMVLILSGCGGKQPKSTEATGADQVLKNGQEVITEYAEQGSLESKADTEDREYGGEVSYPVTIASTNGEELILESEPLRIVSLGPNITELIYSFGVEEKLVGRTEYCDYPLEVLALDTVGTLFTPDIEKILSLEPDLVIASTLFQEESRKQLTELGVSVLVLQEESRFDGVYQMIRTLGTAFNREKKALEIVDDMQRRMDAVRETIKDRTPVSVYYVVSFGDGGDYTAGRDTFIDEILTMAGGQNVAEDVQGWSYSVERLLEADPDVVILSEADYDGFVETMPYSELSAVKNGRVYTIDVNMLDRQGTRNVEAVEEIARMLYPDLFS